MAGAWITQLAAHAEPARVGLQFGIAILVQTSLVLAIALIAFGATKKRGPSIQIVVAKAAVCAVAATVLFGAFVGARLHPLVSMSLPGYSRTAAPAIETNDNPIAVSVGGTAPSQIARGRQPVLSSVRKTGSVPRLAASRPGPPSDLAPVVPDLAAVYIAAASVWVLGTLALLVWTTIGYLGLIRLYRVSEPASNPELLAIVDEISVILRIASPELRMHSRATAPYVAGLVRPVVYIPEECDAKIESPAQMRAVLAHELAHVHYGDFGWNLAFLLVRAVLWPQPLLWRTHIAWRQACEERCDAWVVDNQCSPHDYALCLLRMAEKYSESVGGPAGAVGLLLLRTSLAIRMQRILDETRAGITALPGRIKAACAGVAVLVAAASLLLISTSGYTKAATARKPPRGAFAAISTALSSAGSPLSPSPGTSSSISIASERNQSMFSAFTRRAAPAVATLAALVASPISLPSANADTATQPITANVPIVSSVAATPDIAGAVSDSSFPSDFTPGNSYTYNVHIDLVRLDNQVQPTSGTWGSTSDGATVAGQKFQYRCWPQFGSKDPAEFDVRNCAKFVAHVGIMDGKDGEARFRVDVDGKKRFETTVKSGDKPVAIVIDLSNNKTLSLYRDQISGDAACYFDPVLVRYNVQTSSSAMEPAASPDSAQASTAEGVTSSADAGASLPQGGGGMGGGSGSPGVNSGVGSGGPGGVSGGGGGPGSIQGYAGMGGLGGAPEIVYTPVVTSDSRNLISVWADNSPIRDVLMQLLRAGSKDGVVDADLSGSITANLHRLTFDTALKMVLAASSAKIEYQVDDGVYHFMSAKGSGSPDEQLPQTKITVNLNQASIADAVAAACKAANIGYVVENLAPYENNVDLNVTNASLSSVIEAILRANASVRPLGYTFRDNVLHVYPSGEPLHPQ
jgi:beta-lactamase regulating signal transducer with metallopeptidase domain